MDRDMGNDMKMDRDDMKYDDDHMKSTSASYPPSFGPHHGMKPEPERMFR